MARRDSTMPVEAGSALVIGLGGEVRPRMMWVDGQRSDTPATRDGSDGPLPIHDVTGAAVSIAGVGQDGATVQIGTPLDAIEAGTIYRAEGRVEVTHRADADLVERKGERPKAFGRLLTSIWIERLVPTGSMTDVMRKGSGAAPATAGAQAKGGEAK